MNNLPEHFLEDLEEDYDYNCDFNFIELKICELDNLIKILEEIYFNSEVQVDSLLYIVINKSSKLREYFQLFLKNNIYQNFSCKNT